MALKHRKLIAWSKPVTSLEDKPKMTAAQLKAAFDSNSNQIKPAINNIIDDLTSVNGASDIGVNPIESVDGATVQAVLNSLATLSKSNKASIDSLSTTSGAGNIGVSTIAGVDGATVQAVLSSLATLAKANRADIDSKVVQKSEKGAVNGVASLDTSGKVPSTQLPKMKATRSCRFVIGTAVNGWTLADCDYLCDGTDDQEEINSAIQALPVCGGEILILSGNYNITSPILVNRSKVAISGEGLSTRLVVNAACYCIEINKDTCQVSNLIIDGNNLGGGILFTEIVSNITISNNYFIDCRFWGILCKKPNSINNLHENCKFENNFFRNIKNGGISIYAKNSTIKGNIIESEAESIKCCVFNSTLSENICMGLQVGGYIESSGSVISGNVFISNEVSGQFNGERTVISGNIFTSGYFSIFCLKIKNFIISNNICNVVGDDLNKHAIYVSVKCDNNIISGNNCLGDKILVESSGVGNVVINNV